MNKNFLILLITASFCGIIQARVNDYQVFNWSQYPLEVTVRSLTSSKSCVMRVDAFDGTKKKGICETLDVKGGILGQNCLGFLDIRKIDPTDKNKKIDWKINHPVGGCYSQNFTIDANGFPWAGDITPLAQVGGMLDFKVIEKAMKQLGEGFKEVGRGIAALGGSLLLSLMEADEHDAIVTFCPSLPNAFTELKLDDPAEIDNDTEGLIPLMNQYSPYLMISKKERAWPLSASQLFGYELAIKDKNSKQIIAKPATSEKAYDADRSNNNANYQFELTPCLRAGANPKDTIDKQGILNTPAYVWSYEDSKRPDKLYLFYIYLFAFNYPYNVRKLIDIVKSSEDANRIANAHDFDVEHITIEFDKQSKNPLRIFYGAHGSSEGFWLPFNSPEVPHSGTHAIAYVARGGHGLYNKRGSYIRVYGFANDDTAQDTQWHPQLIRIYSETDPRFKKELHGWASLKHLWYGPLTQTWWLNFDQLGRPYNKVLFCPATNSADEAFCKSGLAPEALPPHQ